MATVNIPYTFSNGDPIIAAEHNANWQSIETFVNALSAGNNFDTGALDTVTIADAAITSAKLGTSLTLTTPNLGVATATSLAISGNIVFHTGTTGAATSYTLALTDDSKIIEINSATAVNLTVPLNSSVAFPVGTSITVLQTGAGQITVVPVSGVIVNSTPGLKIRTQWAAATLLKRATDTWVLMGDLTS
jgi:hypothetical protein